MSVIIVKDSLSGRGNINNLLLAQFYSEIIKNDKFLYSFSFNWNRERGVQKLKISNFILFSSVALSVHLDGEGGMKIS